MRIKVTRGQFLSEIMKTARDTWSLRGIIAKFREYTWGDCLRFAWENLKYRYEIIKNIKPVKVHRIESVVDNYDLSMMYGNGLYNGD